MNKAEVLRKVLFRDALVSLMINIFWYLRNKSLN